MKTWFKILLTTSNQVKFFKSLGLLIGAFFKSDLFSSKKSLVGSQLFTLLPLYFLYIGLHALSINLQ